MAMSHADCTHPRTPAGRAACRKAGGVVVVGTATKDVRYTGPSAEAIEAAERTRADRTGKVRVVPRVASKTVMEATKDAAPTGTTKRRRKAVSVDLKRPGTRLRGNHDLADVPRVFMRAVNAAWERDWEVIVGETFDHTSRRIIVRGEHGDINLAWSASNPNGIQRVSFRPANTSVTTVVSTLNGALRLAMGEDE